MELCVSVEVLFGVTTGLPLFPAITTGELMREFEGRIER